MSYKPQDVFLGVIDLFVIILPGSLLVFGLLRLLYGYPEQAILLMWGGLAAATAFVITAYLLGHLTSLLGSWLEDKWWKRRFDSEGDDPTLRTRVAKVLGERHGLAVEDHPLRVRRWAFKAVRLTDSVATVTIDRKDADRRFFRNALVVLGILSVLFLARAPWVAETAAWAEAGGLTFLTWACWRRYLDQNEKFTREIFEYFILLDNPAPADRAVSEEDE